MAVPLLAQLCAKSVCFLDLPLVEQCKEIASETGARLTLTDDVAEGVKDADYLYTDVWVSMGEPDSVWEERIRLLTPYQVNHEVLEMTGNPAVKFMHCLPAFHNRKTRIGEEIFRKYGLEFRLCKRDRAKPFSAGFRAPFPP